VAKHQAEHTERRRDRVGGKLTALSKAAGGVVFAERAWPPLVWGLAVAILFLAISWLGLWIFAPRTLRIAGVALFSFGLVAALAPLARLRWPSPRDIQARLDRDSGEAHRPATSFADTLANDHDPVAQALWAEHRVRLERSVDAIRIARPSPRMAERDPYALRFAAALLAIGTAAVAGPELYGRLAGAFDWRGNDTVAATTENRIDAWIDPPPYAGRPPTIIDFKSAAVQTLTVFEDSALVVRGDPAAVETHVEGRIAPVGGTASTKPERERRWTIHGEGKATILRLGRTAAEVLFAVTPTGTPTIKLTEEPRANISGSLTLAYRLNDRYGVSSARAQFALPRDPSKPAPRSLAEPPQVTLQLPVSENGAGDARTTADLSEHPWAGAHVTMTLSALSVSGRTGSSGPVEVTLPQRTFHNPLARALVEQRRDLILDPDHAPKRVETALMGLSVAPELFDTPSNVYLGLKQAHSSLAGARSDADLLSVAALLWAMAQQIEDGDASQAERDLRAAEKALREALKRGASDDEIKKLMQQLREAARRFAGEMTRKGERSGQLSPEESNRQAQDLDKLMDRMEEAARNGTREEAEAMLDQMQEMFENMRSAEGDEESPAEQAMRKQMDELGKLLHDQQALRDDTFHSEQRDSERQRAQRRASPLEQDDQTEPDDNAPSADLNKGETDSKQATDGANPDESQLEQRQRELRDRLAELQRMLKSLGMKGEKGFEDAERNMKEAEDDLKGEKGQGGDQTPPNADGQSGKGAAVDAQGRALQALREGAQGMQKQMSQGQGQGRKGQGGYTARRTRPGERPGDDPLGRGREGNLGRDEGSLRELGGVTERARRVMEELRRRLADPNRPIDERDYLERLMKRD
jgi:uncharacterized protein (TIGR02302 family)